MACFGMHEARCESDKLHLCFKNKPLKIQYFSLKTVHVQSGERAYQLLQYRTWRLLQQAPVLCLLGPHWHF